MKLDPIPLPGLPHQAEPYRKIAVIGSGSWGTALAAIARRAGRTVTIWGRDEATLAEIAAEGRNSRYLPDVDLPEGLSATGDLATAIRDADAVMVVIPSQAIRDICREMQPHLAEGVPIAVCAKGIERDSGLLMSQVAEQELPGHPVGVISGPTFAREAAIGHPTAATVAFPFEPMDRLNPGKSAAARFSVSISNEWFRCALSDDVIGVEIGGAVKNVIAIACGMMTGAGFAENTRAALITQGMDEMRALVEALGGRAETVMGLAGIGDLALTCSSPTSRNMSLGLQLGEGKPRDACFDGKPIVVEGERNSLSVTDLARRLALNLPLCEAVRTVLHDGADLEQTFARLWSRPLEAEPSNMDISLDHPAGDGDMAGFVGRTA